MGGLGKPMQLAQQGAAGAPRRRVARVDREQALIGGQRFLRTAELGERGGAMEQGIDAVALGRERCIGALQRIGRPSQPQLDGGEVDQRRGPSRNQASDSR